ncbi:MAG: FHA domain-containing protein [Proteobacteria bacterium]|nr:FHA domain-containing protein [Pseudomonadota bacterium]
MNRKSKFRLKFLFQGFDLALGDFVIGRSPSCNLTLEDPLVSRRHVRIIIYDDHAILDDLGSRNGTLVNSEPVFDNYMLGHSDRIRIGAHELVFVEERRFSRIKDTSESSPAHCSNCGAPFPKDGSQCTACSSPLVPDNICIHCRTPASENALYCSKCGSPLRCDDSTIPVELGGGQAGWTPQLIDEVIEKALSANRFEQAARLIDGQIQEIEKTSMKNETNRDSLVRLSKFNLAVARGLKDERRLKRVIDSFRRTAQPMPELLLDELEVTALGWYEIRDDLEGYLAALESSKRDSVRSAPIVKRLREMIEKTR